MDQLWRLRDGHSRFLSPGQSGKGVILPDFLLATTSIELGLGTLSSLSEVQTDGLQRGS